MGRSGKILATNDYLVPEFLASPLHDVRSDGTIWTLITRTGKISITKTWRPLHSLHSGYVEVSFKGKNLRAHRIVYAKYKGELSEDLVINHKDGLTENNHPDNLELVPQSVNNLHRFRGLNKPPVMGNIVLNWAIVRAIRSLSKNGVSYREISAEYGISKGHISEIVNNHIWIEGKEYAPPNSSN